MGMNELLDKLDKANYAYAKNQISSLLSEQNVCPNDALDSSKISDIETIEISEIKRNFYKLKKEIKNLKPFETKDFCIKKNQINDCQNSQIKRNNFYLISKTVTDSPRNQRSYRNKDVSLQIKMKENANKATQISDISSLATTCSNSNSYYFSEGEIFQSMSEGENY